MRHNNKLILALSLSVAMASGCVDLDTVSKSSMMSNNMWTTEALVDAGVAGIYKVSTRSPRSGTRTLRQMSAISARRSADSPR